MIEIEESFMKKNKQQNIKAVAEHTADKPQNTGGKSIAHPQKNVVQMQSQRKKQHYKKVNNTSVQKKEERVVLHADASVQKTEKERHTVKGGAQHHRTSAHLKKGTQAQKPVAVSLKKGESTAKDTTVKSMDKRLPSSFKPSNKRPGTTPAVTVDPKIKEKSKKKEDLRGKIRIMSLGGLAEIGKNMTVIEYGEDILVVDCGMAFPDEEMPGVDLVIPDITYLVQNANRVRAILITHGHEDHVGAAAYVLSQIRVPVYGTRLSLGIIQGRLEEHRLPYTPELYTVEAGDVISLGKLKAEFIHVNHSIADACAIAIRTPLGTVFHTGDFKLDVSPIDGNVMDVSRIGEIGKEGCLCLLCESTNAERSGFTPSERTVGSSLERIFMQYEGRRLIVATFSSNVHRVQQIIDASYKHGRKVAVLGRSMINVIGAACELGYMDFPDGVLIDVADMKKYTPGEITLITTGSQGEPMSALYRIAFSEHEKVKLDSRDVVVLSSSAIPGNEKFVGKIVNALVKCGVKVVNDSVEEVHVSGHACREELKLMMALLRPKYLMPIHGEYRHLYANKEIGEFMGIPSENIFVSDLGRVLEIDHKGARFHGEVPAGKVLVDGSGVGDIGAVVLRDRKHLSEDGLVVIVATVDLGSRLILSGPDIVSRGFVYVKESENLMNDTRRVATAALEKSLEGERPDWQSIKTDLRDALAKFIYQNTKRKPMILPVIMDI